MFFVRNICCVRIFLSVCLSATNQNTHFRRSWRPLVKDRVPNIGLGWHNFPKKVFFLLLSLDIVKRRGFAPLPPQTHTSGNKLWRPLVEDCVPNIGLGWHFFKKKGGSNFLAKSFGGGSKFFLRAILEGGPKSRVKKFRQKIWPPVFLKIVSSQTNIMNAIFDQRSTRPPEGGVSRWHRHTDRQTYTRTWLLYDQLGPVGPSWWK